MEKNNKSETLTKSILRSSSLYSSTLRVTFDEEVIEKHNKLRGSKMKIDEPKTPFHYFDKEGNEIPPPKTDKRKSLDLVALNNKLEEEKSKLGIEDSDEEKIEMTEKRKSFLEKRRSHYSNEFNGINPFKAKKDIEEDQDKGA